MKNTSILFLITLIGAIASVLTLIVAIATKSYIMAQITFGIACIFCVAAGVTANKKANKKIKKH